MVSENSSPTELSDAEAEAVDLQFETALAHHQAGRIAEAEALYRQVLQVDTEHPGALYLLGGMAYQRGEFQETLELTERALREQPDDPDALHLLGLSAMELSRFGIAVDAIERALALRPDYPEALQNLALALRQLGSEFSTGQRHADAARCLQRLLELHPADAEVLGHLGSQYAHLGDFAAAAEHCQRSLQLQPEQAEVRANLAAAQQQLGQFEQAVENYRRAIAQEPQKTALHCSLGIALQKCGAIDAAIASHRQALALQPDFAIAHDLLGSALLAKNQLSEACASYQRAIDLMPERYDILSNLGLVLARLHRFDEAEQCFHRALELQPDYTVARSNLGGVLMGAGREQEAALEFERCLLTDPDNAEARHLLASLRGETTETAPRNYVTGLFDNYAETFEQQLVGKLAYHTPTLMRSMIDRLGGRRFEHALDLGCGTGLGGERVHDIVDELRGVDLSPKMLKQAELKGIYAHLYAEDVVAFAERSARQFPLYDLVLSADVFIYVGNLVPLFRAVKRATLPGALFIFSVEDLPGSDTYQLLASGRYAHSADYIRTLAADNGFALVQVEPCDLRKERGVVIPGNIFVLTR